ncbi:hypothetical protein XENORESO_009384, partial [Xenotaenia resolanae]
VSDGPITAACSMPDSQFAVTNMNTVVVDVWKLVWNQQCSKASLVKVKSYKVKTSMVRLVYCSLLVGVTFQGELCDVANVVKDEWGNTNIRWIQSVSILSVVRNDNKSVWLTGETNDKIHIGFFFGMGSNALIDSSFSSIPMNSGDNGQENKKRSLVTAITVDQGTKHSKY